MTQTPRTPSALVTRRGEELIAGKLLGRGGEARVYAVADRPDKALKIYERPARDRPWKLGAMLAKPPVDSDRNIGHVSIAWPEELALRPDGSIAGFLMPRVDAANSLPLHQLYHPGSRRIRAPGLGWNYLVRIARNLSSTLASLHEAGYVVGDLNESNILVNDRALVTLVDLDSIQVKTTMRVFRCNVGKVEYTPPELQAKSFRDTTRRPSSDRFGLAVLVFLLLMEGNHPFSGVYEGAGDPPGLAENIRARRSPYFRAPRMRPSPTAPPIDILPPDLRALLGRALVGPAWRRPDARALARELEALEGRLVTCSLVATHSYLESLEQCPWCSRARRLGRDPFPPRDGRSREAGVGRHAAGAAASEPTGAEPRVAAGARSGGTGGAGWAAAAGTKPAAAAGTGAATGTLSSVAAKANAGPPGARPKLQAPEVGRSQGSVPAKQEAQRKRKGSEASDSRPGFRGSWLQFQGRLAASGVLLLAVSSWAVLSRPEELALALQRYGVEGPLQIPAAILAAIAPALAFSLGLYLVARRSDRFALRLLRAERLLRALLLGGAVAAAATWGAASIAQMGTLLMLPTERLLFAALWMAGTLLFDSLIGPRSY